jgi:cell division protein FtsL
MDRVQDFTQAFSQTPWRKQIQGIGLFLLILVLVALVAGVYLNVSTRAAVVGRQIQEMQSNILELERSNADKQSQYGVMTSAIQMRERANALGFIPSTSLDTQYLNVEGYTGRQPLILAAEHTEFNTSPIIVPAFRESLWDWIEKMAQYSSLQISRGNP